MCVYVCVCVCVHVQRVTRLLGSTYLEVIECVQFRRMVLESQALVVCSGHTLAVVCHLYESRTVVLQLDLYVRVKTKLKA
jgi:hypothetical protein